MRDLHIKRCYYSIEDYLNEEFCNTTDEQMYRITYISSKFMP
jgi:hypothetical protein